MAGEKPRSKLGDYFTLQRGTTYKSRLLDQPGPILLGLATIQRNGGFRLDSLRTYGGESPDKLLVQPGELYVSLKDVTQSADLLGAVARLPLDRGVGRLTQDTVKLEPNGKDVPIEYLYWLLRTPQYRSYCRAHATGTTNLGLAREDFLAFQAPEPTPAQRTIAHILNTLDTKIELNRRTNETLEALARAIFKSWFVDFDPVRAKAEGRDPGLPTHIADLFPDRFEDSELGEIPAGWEVGILDQFTSFVLGGDWGASEPVEDKIEPALCIRGADIPSLQIGGTGKMPTRFIKTSSLKKRELNSGDLVIEISGGSPTQSTGRPVLISQGLLDRVSYPLVCSNFCRLLKLNSLSASKFIYLWLRSAYANDEFLQFENGTTGIKNFAFTLFSANYKLVSPPMGILEEFNRTVSPLFEQQQVNGATNDVLAAVRDALLPRLISGELRVGEAERFVEAKL